MPARPTTFSVYEMRGPAGVYVGCTRCPRRRLKDHRWHAANGTPSPLYDAMRRDGADAYEMTVLFESTSRRDALDVEIEMIAAARCDGPCLNRTFGVPVGTKRDPIARKIKAWRGDRPLWKASAILGMDPSALNRLEKGVRLPTLTQALAIAREVGVAPDEWEAAQAGAQGRE